LVILVGPLVIGFAEVVGTSSRQESDDELLLAELKASPGVTSAQLAALPAEADRPR
jgi:hypothetical protein